MQKGKRLAKKILVLLLIVGCVLLSSCDKMEEYDAVICRAMDVLVDSWSEIYEKTPDITDRYLEIKNTRVIKIKENPNEKFAEIFGDKEIDYIVEFILYSNYFDSAPYYSNIGREDCVVFFSDGEIDMIQNPLNRYRNTTYNSDFSDIIESIADLGPAYNHVFHL